MEQAPELTITAIRGCARCGGDHERLAARQMVQPFAPSEAGGLTWTHWAPCPVNGDPILVMVTSERATPPATYLPGPGEPPIRMPVAGPGVPRYAPTGPVVWLIPAAVIVATVLAILCGALWR